MDTPDDPLLRELLERLALIGTDLETSHRRMDEIRRHLASTTDEMRNSRNMRDISDDSAFAQLEALLGTLPVVEQAKGVLMAKTGCSASEALGILRSTSQRKNISISEVAADTIKQVTRAQPPRTRAVPHPRPGERGAGHSKNAVG